ncbi:ATP-binding protein [Cognatiyoonia sp. IB215182]|uniref:ATP-binding protein n=1 Tax=Cognatiyoonia sp. IB215182 TaxID=3097353 RepID=UPI002A179B15|nr:ATP-binding protein [Cognatiyoonia sp. IB215182]MDX8354327.1 ATP-binding protein [Cognatiyoonia sp. IB215182]
MNEEQPHSNSVAPLRNVAALVELVDRVQNRSFNLPGMATFYGPSGFGKTFAAIHTTNRFQAVSIQVKSTWTQKKLCQAILTEIGISHPKTVSDMVDDISQHLAVHDQPLLIDEADFLVQRKMVEIVRDIHEGSGAPVILIGEEQLPQKLREWERVHGRMLDWVAAEPGDMSDVKHLARLYVPGIKIAEEVLDVLLKASHGSIRRIRVNLDHVLELAKKKGLREVKADDWGRRTFFTGTAPTPRKAV